MESCDQLRESVLFDCFDSLVIQRVPGWFIYRLEPDNSLIFADAKSGKQSDDTLKHFCIYLRSIA